MVVPDRLRLSRSVLVYAKDIRGPARPNPGLLGRVDSVVLVLIALGVVAFVTFLLVSLWASLFW